MLRIGAVAVAVLAVALPAAGDTPSTRDARAPRSVAPKVPPYGEDYEREGLLVQQTTAEVEKAKVQFVFPDLYLYTNIISCFATLTDSGYFGSDVAQKTCSEVAQLPLPAEYQDPTHSLNGGGADAYVVTTRGGRNAANTYGSFPAVKVRSLVFGSIPVSATVHLEQTATNGYLDPMKVQYAAVVNTDRVGQPTFPGFPPVPPLQGGLPYDLTFKNQIDATLRLRLTDVAVDGRPVEVGARCGTVAPVRLTVREPLGYSINASFLPRKTRGLPGGFLPLDATPGNQPGYFDGNVSVPAFTNCGSPNEDLDPLFTALVSSPTNRVSGYLPKSALLSYFCSSPVADNTCTPALAAAQRRTRALAAAIAARKSPAEIRKLQAKLKPTDYDVPKVKSNGAR